MTEQEPKQLFVDLTSLDGLLNNISAFSQGIPGDWDEFDIETRINLLESYWGEFSANNLQVQSFREQLKEDDYFKGAGYMRTLSIYSHTKATLQRALRIIRDPTSTTVRTSAGDQQPTGNGQAVPVNNETALAKLQPPTFDGNQADWQRYKDKITSMDINASGPDIFKLERLHQSLTGKAALVVSGIRATAENFRLTWDTLCRQYDNIHRRGGWNTSWTFSSTCRRGTRSPSIT